MEAKTVPRQFDNHITMDSNEGNVQGRRKKRGVYREAGLVSTVSSKAPRNVRQKEDKGVTNGKQRGSKHEECKQGEEGKQGEEFVCPVCRETANTDVVECDKCQNWHHFTCVGLQDVRHELHEVAWACEACTRVENLSDDDVFVDSMGAPARDRERSTNTVQHSGINMPQPDVATTLGMTEPMNKGCIITEPEKGPEKQHVPTLHDCTNAHGSADACNTRDSLCQPLLDLNMKDPRRPQELRSGTSEGNHGTPGTTLDLPADGMLVFATCEDLEAKLEARQTGSPVHSNTAAPRPCMTQNTSIEDKSIICGGDRCSETEGEHQSACEMQIPQDTVSVFLHLAEENTNQNIETLGILAGSIVAPNICVTHLVVPRQKGDSTTCECLDEELVVAALQENGVVQVGWIHTHPSHSTFLSSIDVHTQYRLQSDIPGAVAIVHSHRDGQTGHFRLTERGMLDIANCRQDGFHEGCARSENWGTVQTCSLKDPVSIKAIDLRKVPNNQEQTEKKEESIQKQDILEPTGGQVQMMTEVVAQLENACSAENEWQEGSPPDREDSSAIGNTSKEDNCLSTQAPQQEDCSTTAKRRQAEENNDAMSRKEQTGEKGQKQKRQRKPWADVQTADILAENQALRVEIQQLRAQLAEVNQHVEGTANVPQRISGQPLCAACCGYLMWLHKQYQAESRTVAQDEHAQHIQDGPGRAHPRTDGQVRQSTEHMHRGAEVIQSEPESHHNDLQGTNTTEQESTKNHQEDVATERAWLNKERGEDDLPGWVAPALGEIGTEGAGTQEISIVREQRTTGTQTQNNGEWQQQDWSCRQMEQDEPVRSNKRVDQGRAGKSIWQEQPGPRGRMSQDRYTGGQHPPRWERTGRQTQRQEEEAYLAMEGSNRPQGQHGRKSTRPAQWVGAQDQERRVRDTRSGYTEGRAMRARRHGIKRYQTTIIFNSKYHQPHLTGSEYRRAEHDSRESLPGEDRGQRVTPQQEVRDRTRVLDFDMSTGMRKGEEYQNQGDTVGYQKPHADSAYRAWNRFTGTLNTNQKADLGYQRPRRQDERGRKGQSQDRRHATRQHRDYMNNGYQNWGKQVRQQDLSKYTSARLDQMDMVEEEQAQEWGSTARHQACLMTSGHLEGGAIRSHNSDMTMEYDQPPAMWRKGQLQGHFDNTRDHGHQMALGQTEQARGVRPQDTSRSGAESQSQSADVGKKEETQGQNSATQSPHHYMMSGHQEETRRVRFLETSTNVGQQGWCGTSAMHDQNERSQIQMHTRHTPSPGSQEAGGQAHARIPDQESTNRTSRGQGVGREPWLQTRMTGSQNTCQASASETGPQRVTWQDQVVAEEGFLRGNGSLETMV